MFTRKTFENHYVGALSRSELSETYILREQRLHLPI